MAFRFLPGQRDINVSLGYCGLVPAASDILTKSV
jgi:hypothetical protein